MRKHFHTAEAIFRRLVMGVARKQQRTRELESQQIVALRRRGAQGLGAQESGTLSATGPTPPPGRWESPAGSARWQAVVRRIATSIPPALTFKAVANSRNSLPLPSRLRTKTGIASGNRAHFRRSFPALAPFMQTFPSQLAPCHQEHLRGQMSGKYRSETRKENQIPPSRTAKPARKREFAALLFALHSAFRKPAQRTPKLTKVQAFATLG